jgi:hypothetical protein
MSPGHTHRLLPPDGSDWRDPRRVSEDRTDPDTHRDQWATCWIWMAGHWHPAIVTAWRRTRGDHVWVCRARWGLQPEQRGWLTCPPGTVLPAEPPPTAPFEQADQ